MQGVTDLPKSTWSLAFVKSQSCNGRTFRPYRGWNFNCGRYKLLLLFFSVAMADTVFNVPHISCIPRLFHNPQIQVIYWLANVLYPPTHETRFVPWQMSPKIILCLSTRRWMLHKQCIKSSQNTMLNTGCGLSLLSFHKSQNYLQYTSGRW